MAVVPNSTALKIANNTFDLASDTFYAHWVTAMPAATVDLVSGLSLASGGTYAPITLANSVSTRLTTYGTGGMKVDFDDPAWAVYTAAATPVVGIAICKRVGGSPASTDLVLVTGALNVSYTPGTSSGTQTAFTYIISTNGVLTIGS